MNFSSQTEVRDRSLDDINLVFEYLGYLEFLLKTINTQTKGLNNKGLFEASKLGLYVCNDLSGLLEVKKIEYSRR